MNRRQTFAFIASLLVVAAFSRIIPHAPNFTSMGAVALLGGAWFRNKSVSVLVPMLSLFASDLVLNNLVYGTGTGFVWFYEGAEYVYGSFLLISLIGSFGLKGNAVLKKFGVYAAYSVVSAILFFLISNFGVWMSGTMYPQTAAGLMTCYAAALPYIFSSAAAFLVYGAAIMGIKEWATGRVSATERA